MGGLIYFNLSRDILGIQNNQKICCSDFSSIVCIDWLYRH